MADRGFTIDDLLFPLRVKLNIPAFTKSKPQLSDMNIICPCGDIPTKYLTVLWDL
jgi:hypothetical protein